MIIIIASLFINSAVYVYSYGSPERLPTQVHSAEGPTSTSGRKFEEIGFVDIIKLQEQKQMSKMFSNICHYDEKGIFYEEKGHYYPVKRGFPLLANQGYIVGRPKNGIVMPIYNSEHKPVLVSENDYKMHSFLTKEDALMAYEPIPPQYHVVYPYVPYKPEVKFHSSASAKISGTRNFKFQ
ncbi:uncharacterized protein LOC117167761 [Belonocnema kinseyi]|uniref:uncharacterized protein LOC117167761 n=1 Tax=Belonocnema kinseyi TaxID=2817044 RepID=UPI00143DD3CC|nr:uncharacterized protein LOC117167761 [Belonocnema kinseyi]